MHTVFSLPATLAVLALVSLSFCTPMRSSGEAEQSVGFQEQAIPLPFVEDFHRVKEGALPKGWDGDNSVAVHHNAKISFLEAADKGMHDVQTAKFLGRGDLDFELKTQMFQGNQLEVTLKGNDPDAAIAMLFVTDGVSRWDVSVNKGTPKTIEVKGDRPNLIRLEREGNVIRIIVNDSVAIAKRLSKVTDIERVVLGLKGPEFANSSGTRVHSVSLKTLKQ